MGVPPWRNEKTSISIVVYSLYHVLSNVWGFKSHGIPIWPKPCQIYLVYNMLHMLPYNHGITTSNTRWAIPVLLGGQALLRMPGGCAGDPHRGQSFTDPTPDEKWGSWDSLELQRSITHYPKRTTISSVYIWGVPKIGVPPSRFLMFMEFSLINHLFGVPSFMETPLYIYLSVIEEPHQACDDSCNTAKT